MNIKECLLNDLFSSLQVTYLLLILKCQIWWLQVLPSLDVSFQISPSRLRIQDFLVRLDVVNKTSSESFQVYQLSSIGHHWEISLLQPPDTIFPSQTLMAGQAISCFFTLKVGWCCNFLFCEKALFDPCSLAHLMNCILIFQNLYLQMLSHLKLFVFC